MDAETPKYLTIKRAILNDIRDRQLPIDAKLPSISELMARFGVSKVTVVRALADLEAEGVLRREHGRGTFVERTGASSDLFAPRDTLLVVLPEIRNPLYAEIASRFDEHLGARQVTLALVTTAHDLTRERNAFVLLLKETRLAGMLFVPIPTAHDVAPIEPIGIPLVVLGRCPASLAGKCLSITADDFAGGRLVGKRLAELGHERIGFATYPYGGPERREGFETALKEAGLPFCGDDVFMASSASGGPGPILEFIRERRLTALFALNDMLAMDIYSACREGGLDIPGELSLAGFDNVPLSRALEVPLTSVEVFADQAAQRAAEAIMGQIRAGGGPLRPREVVIMPQLISRASVAPPPGASP